MVWWSEILSKTTALKQTSLCGLNNTANDTITHVALLLVLLLLLLLLIIIIIIIILAIPASRKIFSLNNTYDTTRHYISYHIIHHIISYHTSYTTHHTIYYTIYHIIYHTIPYYIIYLTAIGLPPSGSNIVHIYTQTKHEQHNRHKITQNNTIH